MLLKTISRTVCLVVAMLPVIAWGQVAPPPGVEAAVLQPLEGEAAKRGEATLEEALDALGVPLEPAVGGDADVVEDPPLEVQRAYAAARVLRSEGRNIDAIRELQGVLRLAPRDPAVLRLLGQAYVEAGNQARGAFYLEQAVQQDPGDLAGRFALGRVALQGRQWEKAVKYLYEAAATLESGSGRGVDAASGAKLEPVVRFFLGTALEGAGYGRAAVGQFQSYLDAPRDEEDGSGVSRELAVLDAQRPRLLRALGDLEHRLGNPEAAMEFYKSSRDAEAGAAGEVGAGVDAELTGRMVFTRVVLGDEAGARDAVLSYAGSPGAEPGELGPLVVYLGRLTGGLEEPFTADLLAGYRASGRPVAVAAALMGMLPPEERSALLREHIEANPGDTELLKQALAYVLGKVDLDTAPTAPTGPPAPDPAGRGELPSDEAVTEAISLTLQAMELDPDRAVDAAQTLLTAVEAPQRVLTALDETQDAAPLLTPAPAPASQPATQPTTQPAPADSDADAARQAGAMRPLLRGLALADLGRADDADAALADAAARIDAPDLQEGVFPKLLAKVWLERVKLAVAERDFERAQEMFEQIADAGPEAAGVLEEPDMLALRVGVLRELDRDAEAVALVERLMQERPTPALAMQKSALLDASNDPREALATLRAAIQRHAAEDPEPLSELYDAAMTLLEQRQSGIADDWVAEYESLLEEMTQRLPRERLTRQRMAQHAFIRGDFASAETLLQGLISEEPKDLRAAAWLRELYKRTGREPQGDGLWERTLLANRDMDEQPILLAQHYQEQGRLDEAEAVLRRAIKRKAGPLAAGYASVLAVVLLQGERGEEAVAVLEAAAEAHPHERDQLIAQRANILGTLGRVDEAVALLDPLLEAKPDDPQLNNSLGYLLAYHGRDLERADRLITIALAERPQEAAYLDSRGWVRYKEGNFDAAVGYLKNALALIDESDSGTQAVVNEHLGDALYRTGQHDAATEAWQKAAVSAAQLRPHQVMLDQELRGLVERARGKAAAVIAGNEPEVSPSPGHDARGPKLEDVVPD